MRYVSMAQRGQFGVSMTEGLVGRMTRDEAQALLDDQEVIYELQRAVFPVLERALEALLLQRARQGTQAVSEILEHVGILRMSAVAIFRARDHFKEGGKAPGGINLRLDTSFRRAFLRGAVYREIEVPVRDLQIRRTLKYSTHRRIIQELGGEQVVETHLAHLWEMMKRLSEAEEECDLPAFYIRDANGSLWVVECCWSGLYCAWEVYASSVTDTYGCSRHRRVASY